MNDYISREEAEKVFSQPVTMSMCLTLEECRQKNAQRQIDLFVIRGLPAADVRPVVLCRDCEYYQADCGWCGLLDIEMNVNGFCSRGKKREES